MKPQTTTKTQSQAWSLPAANWGQYLQPSRLETLAQRFAPISLVEMEAAALLNRTDTKFVMSETQLGRVLSTLDQDYSMLVVGGRRLNHYRTLYFDTPSFDLYQLHVNERADRYKVRCREYTDSSLSFLEVKHKTNKDRTIKDRLATSQPVAQMTPEARSWLRGVYPLNPQALAPTLWNTFTRMTLVSKQGCERVTLDVGITFYTAERVTHLDGIAVAEVKRDQTSCDSPFLTQMRAQHIHPRGFSKYCLGVSLLYDQVKKNAMKPRMLWLEKIMQGVSYHE